MIENDHNGILTWHVEGWPVDCQPESTICCAYLAELRWFLVNFGQSVDLQVLEYLKHAIQMKGLAMVKKANNLHGCDCLVRTNFVVNDGKWSWNFQNWHKCS